MTQPSHNRFRIAALMLAATLIWACEGDDGSAGPAGPAGPTGQQGPPGADGPPAGTAIAIGDGADLTAEEIAAFGKLQATITGVTVSSPPVVDFTVLDANGNPAIGLAASTVRFTFVKLMPAEPDFNAGLPYWQSYIVRAVTPDQPTGPSVLANAVQPTTESGGTLEELGSGQYRYTFATDVTNITTPIAVPWEPSLTHRVGMEIRLSSGSGARRPMAPFNPIFDFVPDGSIGSGVTKNIADTNNCQDCHFEFAFHGGQRKSVEYCVTCHNAGHIDPDSGNSLDMAHMAHSIHMGHDRPDPYIIYRRFGGTDRTFDFSEVHFPQSQTYCETCHTDSATHADGDNWNEVASAKSCGGCHADGLVAQNFDAVTGQPEYTFNHTLAGADIDVGVVLDGTCVACHLGAIQTAGPPLAIHSNIRGDDRARKEAGDNFVFEIMGATNTGPGETPVVTFRVTDPAGTPYNIMTDPEFTDSNAALNLYVQWATADYYGGDENGLVVGGRINDDLSIQAIQDLNFRDTGYAYRMRLGAIQDVAVANPDGSFTVTFYRALPAAFTGDVAFALGGHPALETTDADGVVAFERAAAVSAVYYPGAPRQAAFDSAKCNACHERLQMHGANRNGNAEFCLMCHNGDAAVCQSNPDPVDGSCPDGSTQEGYHFGYMIHSIHVGSDTFKKDDGGNFANVHFPQNVANCEACHTPGSYNVARVTARAVSTDQGADIRVWTDDIATTANAAVCGVCHTSIAAQGHFESQAGQVDDLKCTIVGAACGAVDGSSGSGVPNGQEACAVCHGTGSEFETSKYHNPGVE
jgi:OmcA/MtrC family decaheme c-type cytochrome